jgi:carotenoid 1,2-hydratase
VTRTSEARASKAERLRFSSSIDGDAWHGEARSPAYEWWYFDALSLDGRDALVIIFLTNFVFSPRYNRAVMESLRQPQTAHGIVSFPAVAVCFYRDGRPLFRALNEYAPDDFQADAMQPFCRIGQNSFRLIESGSETRYELNIETTLRRSRSLRARLEWHVKEGNFVADEKEAVTDDNAHHWNMVAPRCEVSGEIELIERNAGRSHEYNFQGVGYHDHNRDARWMPATIAEWQWGRIHFPAATAVFYRYRERDQNEHSTRLHLIQNNSLAVHAPELMMNETRRHPFGIRYPRLLRFQAANENLTLNVRQRRVIDGSFFYLRFLSEATLETNGTQAQHAIGITEHLAPSTLSKRWLWWLINMRIGSNGRGALLP